MKIKPIKKAANTVLDQMSTPATKKPPRYVELIRVSTDNQETNDTPERQRAGLDRLRETRPGTLVIRLEIAVSGTMTLDATEEGRVLVQLAQAQGFDELRVHIFDRLFGQRSLDPRIQAEVPGLMFDADAIIVESDGSTLDPKTLNGRIMQSFKGMSSAEDRVKLLKRTNEGRFFGVKNKNRPPGSTLFYGRRFDKQALKWMIVQHEKAIVDRMRSMIATVSGNEIARQLNAEGVPPPRGKGSWYSRTVIRLLQQRHLIGESTYTNKHVPGESAQLQLPVLMTQIEWDRLQQIIATKRPTGRSATPGTKPICIGRIYCPCGKRMYGSVRHRHHYYACGSLSSDSRTVGKQRCSFAKYFRGSAIDVAVWESLVDYVDRADLLLETSVVEPDASGYRAQVVQCERRLAELVDAQKSIASLMRRGLLQEDIAEEQLIQLVSDQKTIERSRQIAAAEVARVDAAAKSGVELQAAAREVRGRLRNAGEAERRELLRALIPDHEGYGITVHQDATITIDAGLLATSAEKSGNGSNSFVAKAGPSA